MIRKISTLLGFGLVILWIAGLGNPYASSWLTWMDGLAALLAFFVAVSSPDYTETDALRREPVALSTAVFILFLVALMKNVVPWQAWWNLGFAAAFLVLGISAGAEKHTMNTEEFYRFEDHEEQENRSA